MNVGRCEKLHKIPRLGQLTKLIGLDISGCPEILELPGVEYLTSLERLYIGDARSSRESEDCGSLHI